MDGGDRVKHLTAAKKLIRNARSVAVSGHINPDGDSIGSLLALGLGLEKLGKKVFMVSRDGVPRNYRVLPGARRITRSLARSVDLAVSVDCSGKEMLGDTYAVFERARSILEIDHHDLRVPFGDAALVDTGAAAVGEIIYALFKSLGVRVTDDIAKNILTSIIVETNSFRLPSVRPHTFRVCADLLESGIDFTELTEMVYWSRNRETAVLNGVSMARCRFLKNGRIAWSRIGKKDFRFARGKDEDVDAFADEMRSIKGVEVAVFFREKSSGKLRVSIRSKDDINVSKLAESFGGGGHFDSAGCYIPNTPRSIASFLNGVKKLLS